MRLAPLAKILSLPWIFTALLVYQGLPAQSQPSTKCDKWEHVLSKKNGQAVLLVEEGCSGFVNGAMMTIELRTPSGRKIEFFKYEDASWNAGYYGKTDPTVKWTDAKRLKISIGAVDYIHKKLGKAGDVDVEYAIEHVLGK